MDYISLGNNIRAKRKVAGLSQAALAEKVGCSNKHISQIENAKNIPSLELVVNIANALNVGVDQLLYGDLSNRSNIIGQEIQSLIAGFNGDVELLFIELVKSLGFTLRGLYIK
jgi:transcriptional regulator with XRE-family HTH domain